MAKRSQLMKMMVAVSILILFLVSGFPVMAYGSGPGKSVSTSDTSGNVYKTNITSFTQNSDQNNSGGYVKYTGPQTMWGEFVSTTATPSSTSSTYSAAQGTQSPIVSNAVVNNYQTNLTLPSGAQEYVYGYVTGGEYPSSGFAYGQYASVTNAAGNIPAALALTTSNTNNFSTSAIYFAIGGVSVSGFSSVSSFYGSNATPSASSASVTFTVSVPGSLVVVVGEAGDGQSISISGIPGLSVDATNFVPPCNQGLPPVIEIASAYPSVGTYTVTEQTCQCAAGQDPNYAGDLIGAFVFAPTSSTSAQKYTVTFTESGLPTGTQWSVTLNGTTKTSTNQSLVFNEPAGTYSYTVIPPTGYLASPSKGSVTVSTSNVTVAIAFSQKTYSVTFTESGLPTGTQWSVTLNGTTKSSTNTITFTVPNGEYNYSVASPIPVNGVEYVATEPSGTVTVNNANVTVVVHYLPVSTTEKLKVYSEFVKYFYSGFNLPNRFFVAAPSINGNQPSSVTGYITGANVTLSFTYNPSSGYWVSNEVNMGGLKPSSYKLTVYAVYGNNYFVEGTYNVTVLEPPPIVLTVLSYIPVPSQAFKLKLSNLGNSGIPLGIGYEWSLEKNITGLFNNEYEIEANVNLNYKLDQDVPVHFLSGKYSTSLDFPIFVTLNSNGVVSIGGGVSSNLALSFGLVKAAFDVGGSAQGNFAVNNYQVVLQSIDASAFLSAYGTYNVPTPLGVSIGNVTVIGFTVSISLGASAKVNTVLVPVNNPSGAIPLAINSVTGNVFIPFGVEGTLAALGAGVGAAGGLQGVAGVGFLLQPGGSSLLESPGGAMVGDVNAFAFVNLVIWSYQGSLTILGPGVLYEWGSVSQSNTTLFEGELNQAAHQFQGQVIGSDWVNGSMFGIITNSTRFGYGYSITRYDGLVYVYYTKLTPSGVAVIRGLVFNGTTAMRAPLPAFNDLGEASPLLVKLNNGSLMSIWAGVPMGHYDLNNLTILLQGSVLRNGAWDGLSNLTKSGDAMSYASDGEYIYLVHEPKLSLTYNNTVLEELTPSGTVVKALNIPGITGITGARSGLVVAQFVNGTYALVNMNTGGVEPINASIAGFSSGLLYYFYNGTLTVINGTQRLTLSLPDYAYAFPVAWSRGLAIVAWRPGLLSAFNWNGTALQPIKNYTTAFTIIPRAAIINNALYLAWFGLENVTNGYGSIYMAILPLTHPTNQSTTTTATYTIAFTESGLPPGTQWSVTFNGLTRSSTANSITFTGVPAGNYTWNASSIIAVGSGTRYVAQTSSGTISVPTVPSVSLYYVKQYSVTVQPTAGGSTSSSGTSWYNAGSTINITATPAPGYEFEGWETNSSITFTNSSSATTNAIVNSAGTIVALFKAVPSSTTSSITSSTTSLITSSTQPSYTIEYVAAAVVVVIVILVAVLLMRRRSNKKEK